MHPNGQIIIILQTKQKQSKDFPIKIKYSSLRCNAANLKLWQILYLRYLTVAGWELVNTRSFPQRSDKTLCTIYKRNMAQAVRERSVGVPSLHIT